MFLPHRRARRHPENYKPSDLQRGAIPIRSPAHCRIRRLRITPFPCLLSDWKTLNRRRRRRRSGHVLRATSRGASPAPGCVRP
jgi:hypothetical protein